MITIRILQEYIRRIFRNYKIYAISILGMNVAIIAGFYIYLFAFKELTVDHFHTHRKNIYRVVNQSDNANFRSTESFIPLGPMLSEKLPQVQDYVRIAKLALKVKGEPQPQLTFFQAVDPSFFDLFDFGLKQGSVQDFMDTPNALVLSEQKATELFGDGNPVGQTVSVISEYGEEPMELHLQITGVLYEIPANSTIQGDMFLNMENYYQFRGQGAQEMEWMSRDADLYVYGRHIKEDELSRAITGLLLPILKSQSKLYAIDPSDIKAEDHGFDLQRMDRIYFDSMDIPDQEKKGDFRFVKILILVGLLTFFMAITNYTIMNLGLNINRSMEFRIRRSMGASGKDIFSQLITESIFSAMVCYLITLMSYPLIGGFIARLIDYEYRLSIPEDLPLLATFLVLVLIIGVIIGILEYVLSYAALFEFQKYSSIRMTGSWAAKKVMIGIQLFLFIGLLTSILFVGKQLRYIQNKDLGYDAENVVSVSTAGFGDELKNELNAKSYVKDISNGQNIYIPDFKLIETSVNGIQNKVDAMVIIGDEEYTKVHVIKLAYGRNLNPTILPDQDNFFNGERRRKRKFVEVLVNEEFVIKAGLQQPIGTVIQNSMTGIKAHIVGVFRNINNIPLYYPVQPTILGFDLGGYPQMFQISCEPGSRSRLVSGLREFFTDKNLPPFVVDRLVKTYDYRDIYRKQVQLANLLQAFTTVVMFITLLGMISISLFVAESRTKEIGIRKVNGATVKEIVALLNKDYIRWIGLAFIASCPVVWYIMKSWLQNFAYRTTLSWWVFAVAGGLVMISAIITVTWQSYRAAIANPVDALQNE